MSGRAEVWIYDFERTPNYFFVLPRKGCPLTLYPYEGQGPVFLSALHRVVDTFRIDAGFSSFRSDIVDSSLFVSSVHVPADTGRPL